MLPKEIRYFSWMLNGLLPSCCCHCFLSKPHKRGLDSLRGLEYQPSRNRLDRKVGFLRVILLAANNHGIRQRSIVPGIVGVSGLGTSTSLHGFVSEIPPPWTR